MENERKSEDGQLIALIADEKTCVGFLLAGIGESDKHGQMNFLVVNERTKDSVVETFFNDICNRRDVAVLLIDEDIARKISQAIKCWQEPFPIIVELPSQSQLFGMKSEESLTPSIKDGFK